MAEEIKILQVNPDNFQLQEYSSEDSSLIASFELDTNFSSSTDYIEYSVYDANQSLIFPADTSISAIARNFTVIEGDINLQPDLELENLGLFEGIYYVSYEFYRKRAASDENNTYYIKEISSDRKELRLSSTAILPGAILSSVSEFIQYRNESTYFVDFYLNFGGEDTIIANNIRLDDGDTRDPSVLIKLYEALPDNLDVKSQCWIVETLSSPQAYEVSFPAQDFTPDDFEFIAGPNYSLNIKGETGGNTQDITYSSLLSSNLTSSINEIQNLLKKKEINISVNYEDYNDFIHFSSAETRLNNFYYKVGLIQSASNQINDGITGATLNTEAYSASNASLNRTIDDIIQNFDGYESFLYFNSGSLFSYPKNNSAPPYTLFPTGSTEALEWLGSAEPTSSVFGGQLLSASNYDEDNQDYLFNTIPDYLKTDVLNKGYELFVDMVGQHYDNVWEYTKNITTRFDGDNRLDFGISKDMVADAIRDFGIKLYQNNFNTDDLYLAFLGLTPSGSAFPVANITGSIDTTLGVPTGSEFVDTRISASNDIVPLDNVNKSVYKRIYHNIPHILKTKGTVAGLRALITSYGIPDTILRVSEFGGQDRVNDEDWDYTQTQFNYGLKGDTACFTSSFTLNSDWNSFKNKPNTIQFRFKTEGIPTGSSAHGSSSPFTQSLWTTDQPVGLILEYDETLLTSGSYSGSVASVSQSYGDLSFFPNATVNPANKATISLPFFDAGWWSVQIDGAAGNYRLRAANSQLNEVAYSGSVEITGDQAPWDDSTQIFWNISNETANFANKRLHPFTGSFQELRYYNTQISKSAFDDFVLNPYSYVGNEFNKTPEQLAFRLGLGTLLQTGSTENVSSVHPYVTGSWDITQSFSNNSSTGSFGNNLPEWVVNKEEIHFDQLASGMRSRSTEKVRLSSTIIPEGNVLSPVESIAQSSFTTESYTANPDYLEVAFSPQNQIDDDITGQLGNFNIGDYIGDPRQISQSLYNNKYPDLVSLSEAYFEKYITSYDLIDFIRLIKFFDNSLFKMIEDIVPAHTTLTSGVVIKQHILERNKYRVPQMSSSFMDYSGSIKPQARNYSTGSLGYPQYSTPSGSAIYTYKGGTGGMFEIYNSDTLSPSGSQGLGPDNRFEITQSWFDLDQTKSGSVLYPRDDQREFYNGEFSGSTIPVELNEICSAYFGIEAPEEFLYFVQYFDENGTLGNQMSEGTFLSVSTTPGLGRAWLWNDGNKVKYIKINLTSANGNHLNEFLGACEFVTFVLTGASDKDGTLLPNGPQTFFIEDASINNANGFALLNIFQEPSSAAVTSYDSLFANPQFSASGDYVWDASQGTENEPGIIGGDILLSTNETASVPQGFFPGTASNFPTEQIFRGWAGGGYFLKTGVYHEGNGFLSDNLEQFNTGAREEDYDRGETRTLQGPAEYTASVVPWFMNASASYKEISSSDFLEFSTLNADTASLPDNVELFMTFWSGSDALQNDDTAIRYYYVNSENKIYISGSNKVDAVKNPNTSPAFNDNKVGLIRAQNQGNGFNYVVQNPGFSQIFPFAPLGLTIPVENDNALYVFRGRATIGTGDDFRFRYNRYMHRPYKIYILTETGSGVPAIPYDPYNPTDRQDFGWIPTISNFDGSQLAVNGNNFSGSTLLNTGSVSGSFEVYSQERGVVAWTLTKYSKLFTPPRGGTVFSISKSDGTPVGDITQGQGTSLNLGPVELALDTGSYQFTSSVFPNSGVGNSINKGQSYFGLKTSFGDYASYQYTFDAAEAGTDIRLSYIDTNNQAAELIVGDATAPGAQIAGKSFQINAATSVGLTFTGNTQTVLTGIVQSFVAGAPLLGDFSSKIDRVYIEYSSSLSSSDAGSYTFESVPSNDLSVTGSATLSSFSGSIFDNSTYGAGIYGQSTYGAGTTGGGPTWTTASLHLYYKSSSQAYPGSRIQTNTYFSDDFGTTGATIFMSKSIDYTDPVGAGSSISIGDQLFMSLEVDNGDHSGFNISSSLIATEYSMSITSSTLDDPGPVPTIFQDLSDFSRAFDCQPLLNNYVNDRLNSFVMNVDYSTNILYPVNFEQLINFSASKASIPDSFYSSFASIQPRYLGSRLNAQRINYFTPGDTVGGGDNQGAGLGKVPTINHSNAYVAFFTDIIDPYPVVNNKTTYYIKYLIDSEGQLFEPGLTAGSYYNLIGTFKDRDGFLASDTGDLQTEPTFVSGIVRKPQNREGKLAPELARLANYSGVYKSGVNPIPVIYSQTSSNGYVTEIPLTGSGVLTSDDLSAYSDYAFQAESNREFPIGSVTGTGQAGTKFLSGSNYLPAKTSNQTYDNINISEGGDYTFGQPVFIAPSNKFGTGQLATSSYDETSPTGSIFFLGAGPSSDPFDANTPGFPSNPTTLAQGQPLSDDYTITAEFTFYTTGLPFRSTSNPVQLPNGNGNTLGHFQAMLMRGDNADDWGATSFNTRLKIIVDSVELKIQRNIPDDLSGAQYLNVTALNTPNYMSWSQPAPNGIRANIFNLEFMGVYLRDSILASGGTIDDWVSDPSDGGSGGYSPGVAGATRYQWTVKLRSNETLLSGYYYRWQCGGYIRNFNSNDDYWCGNGRWSRGFMPNLPRTSGESNLVQQKLQLRGLKTAAAQGFNRAPSTYFFISGSGRFQQNGQPYVPPVAEPFGSGSVLLMSSSILNDAYNNGFKAGDLDYQQGPNPNFPFNQEPDFIQFPPIPVAFDIRLGDEIRFGNDETLSYRIVGPTPQSGNVLNTFDMVGTQGNGQRKPMLRLELDGIVPPSTDVDFFLIRRFENSRNLVILDQQKPYGVIRTGSVQEVENSTAPGILRPEFVIQELNINPEKIFEDLIEKKILT